MRTPSPRLFNKTCSIKHYTPSKATTTTTGEVIYTATTVTGVKCKVDVKTALQDDDVFRSGEAIYFIYFPNGTDVRSTDEITSIPGYTNVRFTVSSIPMDDVGRGAYIKTKCKSSQGQLVP